MKFIDIKYIRLASVYLQGFKDVGRDTYIFRCPICGDSKKSASKKRGYLYATNDGAFFKCYNGCAPRSLYSFLAHLNIDLARQYATESFGASAKPKDDEPEFDKDLFKTGRKSALAEEPAKVRRPKRKTILDTMLKLEDLPHDHPCREYVRSRFLPEDVELYFAPHLNETLSTIEAYKDRLFTTDYKALVFPFRGVDGTLNYLQARLLFNTDNRRFCTMEIEEDAPKFWGLDLVDFTKPVYLFEGPIDAMMIDNGVAFAGGNLRHGAKYLEAFCQAGLILVYDRDFVSNDQIFLDLLKSVKRDGRSIVIYDKEFATFKDVNDARKAGWSREKILQYLQKNTFTGLKAELKLATIKTPKVNKKWI